MFYEPVIVTIGDRFLLINLKINDMTYRSLIGLIDDFCRIKWKIIDNRVITQYKAMSDRVLIALTRPLEQHLNDGEKERRITCNQITLGWNSTTPATRGILPLPNDVYQNRRDHLISKLLRAVIPHMVVDAHFYK